MHYRRYMLSFVDIDNVIRDFERLFKTFSNEIGLGKCNLGTGM